ncbi:Uma2 family endonuclease [Kitasatospora sp. NPDC058444]|uniref:Uma2 family endonuclease n=1 Tax=Kitasatospora sp. NPDC058444 TaxID=3346504 RepID=UPI00365C8BCF
MEFETVETEIIEGVAVPVAHSWAHQNTMDLLRQQLAPALRPNGLCAGSGDLALPGTTDRYLPDLAVVPAELARGEGALPPDRTLLVVEATEPSSADTDRTVKRRRYARFGAPLYLLVDRQERACTLFSQPGALGYTRVEGPHPFGVPVRLPEPFELDLDTGEF